MGITGLRLKTPASPFSDESTDSDPSGDRAIEGDTSASPCVRRVERCPRTGVGAVFLGPGHPLNYRWFNPFQCHAAEVAGLGSVIIALHRGLPIFQLGAQSVIVKTDVRLAVDAIRRGPGPGDFVPSVDATAPGDTDAWWDTRLPCDRCQSTLRRYAEDAVAMIRLLRWSGVEVYVWNVHPTENSSAHRLADTGGA